MANRSMMDHKRPLLLAAVATLAACSPKGEALYARAQQSLADDDSRAAIIDLKNLVKNEPQNGKARALLAYALVEGGDVEAAAIELKKARDLKPPADVLVLPECRVSVASGELEKALQACSPAQGTGKLQAQLQVAQGQALLGLSRAPEAKPLFNSALSTDPANLDALIGLANATATIEGLPAGLKVMETGSPELQKRSGYWLAVGGLHSQNDNLEAAESAYRKALGQVRKGATVDRMVALGALGETQMLRGDIAGATSTTDELAKLAPENPLVKQLRGQVAAAAGKTQEARTLLEQAVAAMPENYVARTLLGIVNMQEGNIGQAEMHFQSVLAKQPNNTRVQRLLAEVRAKSQTPEQALAGLKPSLAGDSADPQLLAMAGRMSLESGNRAEALQYFTQASANSQEGKQPADVQIEIANGYLMAGEIDRAVEVLERIPEGGAAGFQRDYLMVAALIRKGEMDKAVTEARKLVQQRGNDPAVRNLVAGVLVAAGQKDEARVQFAQALKIKPNDPATLINLARLDISEGKLGDARKGFASVLDADPKNVVAMVGMAAAAGKDAKEAEKWLRKASEEHPESPDAQMALAQFYLNTGDLAKAKNVVDAAVARAPDNAALSNTRGLVLMATNDMPGALASFKKATTQEPRAHGYALNLARAHLATSDVNSALGVLNDVLKDEPKYTPALALAAAASLQAGKHEAATGYVERLRQVAPNDRGTYALEGDLAMATKRYADALAHYRKASEQGLNTQLVLAQYRAAGMAGDPQAEKIVEDWIQKNPTDVTAVTVLAEQRRTKGDLDGAARAYEVGLKAAPDNPLLLNNTAMVYAAKGDPRAMQLAERAFKAAPKSPAIQDTYGWILFKGGQTDRALDMLRAAESGLGNNPEVQYHLAAALAKKGDKDEARGLLQKALKGQLPQQTRTEAESLMKQLSK